MQPTQAVQQAVASSQPCGVVSRFRPHLPVAISRPRNVGGACGRRNDRSRNPQISHARRRLRFSRPPCWQIVRQATAFPPAIGSAAGAGRIFCAELPASGLMLADRQPGQ